MASIDADAQRRGMHLRMAAPDGSAVQQRQSPLAMPCRIGSGVGVCQSIKQLANAAGDACQQQTAKHINQHMLSRGER